MQDHTDLVLYTEGFTTVPRMIVLRFSEEIRPDGMLEKVRGWINCEREHPLMIGMIEAFYHDSDVIINPENASGGRLHYELSFTPEDDSVEDGNIDFAIINALDEKHSKPLREWSDEAANSCA